MSEQKKTDVDEAAQRALDEAGIEIPFPIRTLDLARAESSLREIVPERATA